MVKHRIKTLEEFHAEHPKSGKTEGYDCGDLIFIPDMWHLAGTLLTDDETEKILRRKKAQLSPKNAPAGQDNRWYFNKEMIRPLVMSGDLRQMLQSKNPLDV